MRKKLLFIALALTCVFLCTFVFISCERRPDNKNVDEQGLRYELNKDGNYYIVARLEDDGKDEANTRSGLLKVNMLKYPYENSKEN